MRPAVKKKENNPLVRIFLAVQAPVGRANVLGQQSYRKQKKKPRNRVWVSIIWKESFVLRPVSVCPVSPVGRWSYHSFSERVNSSSSHCARTGDFFWDKIIVTMEGRAMGAPSEPTGCPVHSRVQKRQSPLGKARSQPRRRRVTGTKRKLTWFCTHRISNTSQTSLPGVESEKLGNYLAIDWLSSTSDLWLKAVILS